jgi:hypothetical protein
MSEDHEVERPLTASRPHRAGPSAGLVGAVAAVGLAVVVGTAAMTSGLTIACRVRPLKPPAVHPPRPTADDAASASAERRRPRSARG